MPQYALLADHTPDICPGSNARTRQRALEGTGPENMQKVCADLGISFVVEPLHLDPSHRVLAVLEAPSIETVTESGVSPAFKMWIWMYTAVCGAMSCATGRPFSKTSCCRFLPRHGQRRPPRRAMC